MKCLKISFLIQRSTIIYFRKANSLKWRPIIEKKSVDDKSMHVSCQNFTCHQQSEAPATQAQLWELGEHLSPWGQRYKPRHTTWVSPAHKPGPTGPKRLLCIFWWPWRPLWEDTVASPSPAGVADGSAKAKCNLSPTCEWGSRPRRAIHRGGPRTPSFTSWVIKSIVTPQVGGLATTVTVRHSLIRRWCDVLSAVTVPTTLRRWGGEGGFRAVRLSGQDSTLHSCVIYYLIVRCYFKQIVFGFK